MYLLSQNQSTLKSAPNTLVQPHGLAHGALDEETLDILPVLFEQGNEEIDCQHDVVDELVLGHFKMADGDSETQDLGLVCLIWFSVFALRFRYLVFGFLGLTTTPSFRFQFASQIGSGL
jgi:hypothetical protein